MRIDQLVLVENKTVEKILPIRLAQSQFCFEVPRLRQFMRAVRDLGLHEKVFILIGAIGEGGRVDQIQSSRRRNS